MPPGRSDGATWSNREVKYQLRSRAAVVRSRPVASGGNVRDRSMGRRLSCDSDVDGARAVATSALERPGMCSVSVGEAEMEERDGESPRRWPRRALEMWVVKRGHAVVCGGGACAFLVLDFDFTFMLAY